MLSKFQRSSIYINCSPSKFTTDLPLCGAPLFQMNVPLQECRLITLIQSVFEVKSEEEFFFLALSDASRILPRVATGGLINHPRPIGQRESHGAGAQQMRKDSTLVTIRASIQRAGLWAVDYQHK